MGWGEPLKPREPVCALCSARVVDLAVHRDWHRQLERRIVDEVLRAMRTLSHAVTVAATS